jgi:hypothetical protein
MALRADAPSGMIVVIMFLLFQSFLVSRLVFLILSANIAKKKTPDKGDVTLQ